MASGHSALSRTRLQNIFAEFCHACNQQLPTFDWRFLQARQLEYHKFSQDVVLQEESESALQEPYQMVEELSALGLRHVGYAVPTVPKLASH